LRKPAVKPKPLSSGEYGHVYLSPHLDDAVLSCGGRIGEQARAGEQVLVVTVFAELPAPGTPLSPFAQELHTRWGYPADAALRRQREDQAALATLGADPLHWPYADCVYRQTPDGHFPYASEEALWGAVHPTEERLVAELAARLATLPLVPGSAVYAPLGAGHHVDHQIVRRAAEACGASVVYYEDFPYAEDPHAVCAQLVGAQWRTELVPLSEEALKAKIAAIACYRSQISTFWTSLTEMSEAVRAFAEAVGDGRPAERYWVPSFPTKPGASSSIDHLARDGMMKANRQQTSRKARPTNKPTIAQGRVRRGRAPDSLSSPSATAVPRGMSAGKR